MKFWSDKFSNEEIQFALNKIKQFRRIQSDGKVALTMNEDPDSWIAFLVSATGFNVRTDALRKQIVQGVIFSPELKKNFSENDFKEIAYKLKIKYKNIDTKVYKVVFPIWNKPEFLRGTRKIDDVTINFSPSNRTRIFKKITQERNRQRLSQEFQYFFTKERLNDLNQCFVCIVHVKANSPADANERASEAIYEILGLINLAKDAGKHSRSSSRVRGKLPVSEVLLGPHTTTHFKDGKLTHVGFWHENWVGGPIRSSSKANMQSAWAMRYNQLAKGVSQSVWRSQCKTSAARYFKAFSNPDLEESFLDGWRLFENVTGSQFEKFKDQINRASNIFEDNIEHRIIGKHLALRRNLIAHGHPIKTNDEEVLAFQMLRFIRPFLEFFILNRFSFQSPEDFWEFLDLPSSKIDRDQERDELNRRLSLFEKAAHFHRD